MSPVVDLWTLIHLFAFAFIASSIQSVWRPRPWVHIAWWAVASYGWETVEYFLQRQLTGPWGNVIEHWANAWITDPAANLLGVSVGVLVSELSRRAS